MLNVPPPSAQPPCAVAWAVRLEIVPPVMIRPADAARLRFRFAELPSTRLRVLLPNVSVALPVTVSVSLDAVYVTRAVVLNVPPATDQFAAVASAVRLNRTPFSITRPDVAGMLFAGSARLPSARLSVFCDDPVPKISVAFPVRVSVSGVAKLPDPLAGAYVTSAVVLKLPPATVQFVAVASAVRLNRTPFSITRPDVAGMLWAGSATFPSARLSVFCDDPVPRTSVAFPVSVSVSGMAVLPDPCAAAYVTSAVALNVPPATDQFVAVASAVRLNSAPFSMINPVVAGTLWAGSARLPSDRLSVF